MPRGPQGSDAGADWVVVPTSDAEPQPGIDTTGIVAADPNGTGPVRSGDGHPAGPVTFDFAGSGRLTRQRARLIQGALDEIARQATDALRLWVDDLRVEAADVEQRTVADLCAGDVDRVALILPERGEEGLVVTELPLARSLVLTLLGAPGADDRPPRPLTALEAEVLDLVLVRLLTCAGEVLGLGPVELGVHESSPATVTSLDERDLVLGIPFLLSTGRFSGRAWIVLAASALQPFTAECERRQAARPVTGRPSDRQRTEVLLQGVTVPVVCGFPSVRVPAAELAFLAPGDVLRTGHPTSRDLVVSVGGTPLYTGRASQRGLRLVTEIVETLPNHRAPNPSALPGGSS